MPAESERKTPEVKVPGPEDVPAERLEPRGPGIVSRGLPLASSPHFGDGIWLARPSRVARPYLDECFRGAIGCAY